MEGELVAGGEGTAWLVSCGRLEGVRKGRAEFLFSAERFLTKYMKFVQTLFVTGQAGTQMVLRAMNDNFLPSKKTHQRIDRGHLKAVPRNHSNTQSPSPNPRLGPLP